MRLRALQKEVVYSAFYATGVTALRRARLSRHVLIFTYHSFSDSAYGAMGESLPVRAFEAQVRHLKRNYEVVPLADALRTLEDDGAATRRPKPLAVISVDDGFGDNFHLMAPVIRSAGLPVTVFLATDFLDSGRAPWPTLVRAIVQQAQVTRIRFPFEASMATGAERDAAAGRIKRAFKVLEPEERFAAIAELARHAGVRDVRTPPPLTWAQVRAMREDGVRFGSHTVYHSLLPFVSRETVRRELVESRARIERELDEPCEWLAYPNGDYDDTAVELARDAGYRAALTQDRGSNVSGDAPLTLRRIQVPHDESLACFACRASLTAF